MAMNPPKEGAIAFHAGRSEPASMKRCSCSCILCPVQLHYNFYPD